MDRALDCDELSQPFVFVFFLPEKCQEPLHPLSLPYIFLVIENDLNNLNQKEMHLVVEILDFRTLCSHMRT